MGQSKVSVAEKVDHLVYVKLPSENDSIWSITYPNSSVKLTPNFYQSQIFLSEAYDSTILYLSSSLGLDTLVIEQKKEIIYSPKGNCDDENFICQINEPKVNYHTFGSCFIKKHFSYASQIDTLIVEK